MGVFILVAVPLAFAAYHLSMRKQLLGRESHPPSQATPGKEVTVVGIAQPWEQPGTSRVTGQPVLWNRAHFVSGRRDSGPPLSAGKVSTHFQIVDERDRRISVAIDSARVRDVRVRNRVGDGSAATGRYEEKAVYPGERVWVVGELTDTGGFRGFGKGAVLLDEHPATRAGRHGIYASVGLALTVIAAMVAGAAFLTG